MDHDKIEELFLDYCEATLSGELLQEFQAHLRSCPECQTSLARYETIAKLERLEQSRAESTSNNWEEVRLQIEALTQQPRKNVYSKAQTNYPFIASLALNACSAIALVGLYLAPTNYSAAPKNYAAAPPQQLQPQFMITSAARVEQPEQTTTEVSFHLSAADMSKAMLYPGRYVDLKVQPDTAPSATPQTITTFVEVSAIQREIEPGRGTPIYKVSLTVPAQEVRNIQIAKVLGDIYISPLPPMEDAAIQNVSNTKCREFKGAPLPETVTRAVAYLPTANRGAIERNVCLSGEWVKLPEQEFEVF